MDENHDVIEASTRDALCCPGLSPCALTARSWLKEHGVDYVERNVAGDFGALRAMYDLTRQRRVPVFAAKGRAVVRPSY